jgi:hypothetical protein
MKQLILSIYFSLAITMVFAQKSIEAKDSTRAVISKVWRLNVSYLNFGSVDKIFAPLIYSGKSFDIGGEYELSKPKFSLTHKFSGTYLVRKANSLDWPATWYISQYRFLNLKTWLMDYSLSYSRDFPCKTKHIKVGWSASSIVFANLSVTDGVYPEIISLIFAPGVWLSVQPSPKNNFTFGIKIPILSAYYRTSYSAVFANNTDEDGYWDVFKGNTKLASLDKFKSLQFDFQYLVSIFKKMQVGIRYSFDYQHYTFPRELNHVSGKYSIVLAYKMR